MSQQSHIRIAGVPEAFNDAFFSIDFTEHGVECAPEFVSTPGGSGAMLRALETNQVDAAFMLTESLVAAIENGRPVRLSSALITSPLRWGVTVKPNRHVSLDDLKNVTWGISRFGSGSHVMVRLLAARKGWPTPNFVQCDNFANLRNAVQNDSVDAFLWEHFTTKPFADAGHVSIIDDVPTPWGCFVVAVHQDCSKLHTIRRITDAFLKVAADFVCSSVNISAIAHKHGMKEGDARLWAASVSYASPGSYRIPEDQLGQVRHALLSAGVISDNCQEGGESKFISYFADST